MLRPDFREISHSNELYHYGIKRRSGRYPYGSGERPYQSEEKNKSPIERAPIKNKSELLDFNKDLNSWDYGVLINGKKITSSEKVPWQDYKTIPVKDVEKNKVGVCWDFVNYQHEVFKKSNIKDESRLFVMQIGSDPNNIVTHTFSTIEMDGKKYWFESSWMKNQGLHEISSYKDVVKKLKETYGEGNDYDVYKYDPEGLDKGLTNGEFFKRATKNLEYTSYPSFKHSQESEVKFKMNRLYYLSHGGPGSGRYPLGSGERPYQKFEGSGRRRSGISGYIRSVKSKKAEEKQQKQRNEELRKRMEEEQKKRQHDSDKERVLREGTATEVLKYQGELTNQELQNAFTRLNLESQLRNLSQREMKTAMDKVDNLMKTVKTGTEWAKIGTDTYNTFAAIYNATPEGQKKPLTLVGKGGKDKSKKND